MLKRLPLPRTLQIKIFRRDGWLCHLCKRPVIFAPAMRLLEREVMMDGYAGRLAYYNERWTREGAPLLDQLAAVIDHVEAHAKGGKNGEDNLATACCKCNAQKSDAARDQYLVRSPKHKIKGKFGEPQHWDGLSTLFVTLANRDLNALTVTEQQWLKALTSPAMPDETSSVPA
ncbi:MAG TPA: HNH endonuclease signature motif containing protein [Sphingomicrobium sp.]|nr:HNH endonuclease signature motif containing protein [Sphingomicrobium sp.]